MGKRIVVAGAGHGGIIAAYNLAKAGYDVSILEMKAKQSELGYDWEDTFDIKAFERANLPVASEGVKDCLDISFHGPEEGQTITQIRQGHQSMRMFRQDLYDFIIDHALMAGAKIEYGVKVQSPIMLGNRIVGVKTNKKDYYADLIIDSAGANSPLRENLPEYLGIKNHFDYPELLTTYRAYYDRTDKDDPAPDSYNVYFLDEGGRGLNWIITEGEYVDILLGRLSPFYDGEIDEYVEKLRKIAPYLGFNILHGGQICQIPVRQPLGVMVADGYAAIGDAAGMTVPLLGSGIYQCFCAGALLAHTVIEDENDCFSAYTLYPYQRKFFSEFASSSVTIALMKKLLTSLTKDEVEFFMGSGIVSTEDVSYGAGDPTLKTFLSRFTPAEIYQKLKIVKGNKEFVSKVMEFIKNFSVYQTIGATMPSEYTGEDVIKWGKRYERFFENLYN